MIKVILISPVGTSLIGNYCREKGLKFEGDSRKIDLTDLIGFIRNMGYEKASSETNSIINILESENIDFKCVHLILLPSETGESIFCAKALKDYLDSLGITTEIDVVKGLKYEGDKFVSDGLRNLVNKLIEHIEHGLREKRKVILNATPGFKAESAYMTLVGLLFGVDTYYIHEKFKSVVKLPHIPISFDETLWVKHESVLREILRWRPKNDIVSKYGSDFLTDLSQLIEEANGEIRLGPAGIAFYLAGKEKRGSLS